MSVEVIQLGLYEYSKGDALGSGAFALVYKGRFRDNKTQLVAIKKMRHADNVNPAKTKALLAKEISVLKDLNHENIVRLYDHSISQDDVYIVMEYCNGGDLSEYLHCMKTLAEETIRHFLIQIGSAMYVLNEQRIVHRDLKPGNILLSYYGDFPSIKDVPGHLITFKLADFGFARFLEYGVMAETMCGSPMYMAPEVLMCQKYNARADIWSLGIIVYQCFCGKAPFYAPSPEALKNIYLKTPDLKPKLPSYMSLNLRDLLLKMLVRKPSHRIDFRAFLDHPFLTEKHVSPSDLRPKKPATAPPLPVSNSRRLHSNLLSVATNASSRPGFPSTAEGSGMIRLRRGSGQPSRGVGRSSTIADLLPTATTRNTPSRLVQPALMSRRTVHGEIGPLPPPPPPPERITSTALPEQEERKKDYEDSSGASLTPTEDEFIEDGLGGSSFMGRQGGRPPEAVGPRTVLTTSVAKPGETGIWPNQQNHGGMDNSLDGFVVIESDGSEFDHVRKARSPQQQLQPEHRGKGPSRHAAQFNYHYASSILPLGPQKSQIPRKFNPIASAKSPAAGKSATVPCFGATPKSSAGRTEANSNASGASLGTSNRPSLSTAPIKSPFRQAESGKEAMQSAQKKTDYAKKHVRALLNGLTFLEAVHYLDVQLQAAREQGDPSAGDEQLQPGTDEHEKEIQTMAMVLDLCELLAELATRRASPLTDCTTTSGVAKQAANDTVTPSLPPLTDAAAAGNGFQAPVPSKLKLVPEAKRIVEQLVLYRRILYYLEYIFVQMKTAFANNRLKPVSTAKRFLTDCNALYHRCYIRLSQLTRLSQRPDLLEPVGRELSRITANKLIYKYALAQCYAAEMDDYMGELGLALQRYMAGLTLIHGLIQHATSESDKSLLHNCLNMLHKRYQTLAAYLEKQQQHNQALMQASAGANEPDAAATR